ncbi:MAG: hypothetical protein LUE93_09080, partial [Bacteroides sp.]|nr:hypothetical protein [Bacteroides sp.]
MKNTKRDFLKLYDFIFPEYVAEQKLSVVFFLTIFIKFFLFNIIWCSQTSFAALSKPECYLYNLLAVWLLLIPLVCFRMVRTTLVIMFLLDLLF